jgi:diketogulonate reductase-like aldo/keto reductase
MECAIFPTWQTSTFKCQAPTDEFIINFCYLKAKPEEVEKAVEAALEEGYRLVDTAFNYNNEEAIGRALRRWVNAGRCRRQDLFITTKVKQSKVTVLARI